MYGRLMAVGEMILATLSFLFYRIVRFGVQGIVQLASWQDTRAATRWQTLEGRAVSKPFNLLALMTCAPRWNTHALIALVGPLHVQRTLKICAAAATKSASSWTVVVHAEPGHRMVASIGSLTTSSEQVWQALHLAPGTYRLALRYYHWSAPVELPAIEVDGAPVVNAVRIPAHTNDFYHDLSQRSNFFYLCLHSYVCTLLRYRRWFPRSFVEREYLPAGNPQTTFYYGFLQAGARLIFELDPDFLQTHEVYFTVYNRASFPILWYPLLENTHITPPSPVSGSYLLRVQRKTPTRAPFERDRLRICVQTADPAEGDERVMSEQSGERSSGIHQEVFN